MQQFIAKFEKNIQGVLSGFDRVLFRGSLRRLTHSLGMKWYLSQNDILCKHYEDHVKAVSQKIKKAALAPFQQQKLPVEYVYGCDDKEKIARAFASERRITEGDVCALTVMEMAPTFRHEKKDMVVRPRPCLTIYLYRIDPQLGWMHARIQTWFPFYIHVCINGREWLARRMDRPTGGRLVPASAGHRRAPRRHHHLVGPTDRCPGRILIGRADGRAWALLS